MSKRFYLPKLLKRTENGVFPEAMITNVKDLAEQDIDDVVAVAGFVISEDGLKDLFYATCFVTGDKDALFKATLDAPVSCTVSLEENDLGFPSIKAN